MYYILRSLGSKNLLEAQADLNVADIDANQNYHCKIRMRIIGENEFGI